MASQRDRVLQLLSRQGRPALTARALLGPGSHDRTRRKALLRLLASLEEAGTVERVGRRYRLARRDTTVEGTFTPDPTRTARDASHAVGGVVMDDAGNASRVQNPAGAEAGDRVLVSRASGSNQVVQVLRDPRQHWLGILSLDRRRAVVTPYRDDGMWEVRIAQQDVGSARNGEVVVVEPLKPTRHSRQPRGKIVECLGFPGEPEADFRAVAWRRRLPVDFPPAVEAEARALAEDLEAGEIARRRDLRSHPFVTIDPSSARDFDDAVHAEPAADSRIRLWVAIADVSHFVAEGSALDREALLRGNSVYFPDRAIPMLPERLSGDLCSLRPDTSRFAMVVELLVDREGKVEASRFHDAVIRSCARLTYAQAAERMEGGNGAAGPRVPDDAQKNLETLGEVAKRLAGRRFARGSIELEIPSSVIVVDADGRTRDIVREQRTVAHRAVEEAMLAANRAVANRLEAKDVPTIYRIHEPPLDEKLAALCDLLQSYGLVKDTGGEALSGQQIHRALRNAADRPEAALVNLAALRSMAQARYDTENRGHFALGFDSYLHFTSPIRRYADLVVHRALKRSIGSSPPHGSRDRAARGRLSQVAFRISERERAAVEAEREIGDLRACAFMASRVGEVYSGIVTGVAAHGLYVRLDEIFVEGLVHVSRLPEQVELDEARHALVAVRSGRRYRLGDALRVRVEEVNQVRAWINFGLPTKPGSAPTTKSPAGRSKPRARRQDVPSRGRGRRSRPGSRRGRR